MSFLKNQLGEKTGNGFFDPQKKSLQFWPKTVIWVLPFEDRLNIAKQRVFAITTLPGIGPASYRALGTLFLTPF